MLSTMVYPSNTPTSGYGSSGREALRCTGKLARQGRCRGIVAKASHGWEVQCPTMTRMKI